MPSGMVGETLLAVARKIDAIERLGANTAAEVDELVRAHAVSLLAAPEVIADQRAFRHRPHSFAPLVMTTEEAAEA